MWKYVFYGVSGAILMEASYYLFVYIKKKIALRNEVIVSDVIWINEETQKCANNHYSYKNGLSIASQGEKCKNPFCKEYNMGKLISYIDGAKCTLDLAMYTLNSTTMMNAIKRAMSRKVIVRIITDKEMAYSTNAQMRLLAQAGAPVRFPLSLSANLMHHKFLIIDGHNRVCAFSKSVSKKLSGLPNKNGFLLSGSLNWTTQGLNNNWENILITSDKTLVGKYEEEFERMWQAFKPK